MENAWKRRVQHFPNYVSPMHMHNLACLLYYVISSSFAVPTSALCLTVKWLAYVMYNDLKVCIPCVQDTFLEVRVYHMYKLFFLSPCAYTGCTTFPSVSTGPGLRYPILGI